MKATVPRLELTMEQLRNLVEHARTEPLSEEEYAQLKAAIETLGYLTQLVEDKYTTIQRLRQILFGAKAEKTDQVLNQQIQKRESSRETMAGSEGSDANQQPKPKGHGRNGAQAYAGGNKVQVSHARLKRGDRCPECSQASSMS